jgi:hypothetical protein
VKFRGGELVSQGACSDLYKFDLDCGNPCSLVVVLLKPSVKSPLCNADRGLSICSPA